MIEIGCKPWEFQVKTGRFFVTAVVLLGTVLSMGCEVSRTRKDAAQAETERKASLVAEGNAKIQEAEKIREELRTTYGVHVSNVQRSKDKMSAMATPEKFNWKTVNLDRRREIQAKLAKYLQLVNRVLEIDAQRLITVDRRDMLIIGRENAEAFQRSLESAEGTLGENFNPPPEVRGQVPTQLTDIGK